MRILGIESTCDETSAAVVEDGRKILSNVVASSSMMHKKYGGIVPEVAAREQIRVIIPVLKEALSMSVAGPAARFPSPTSSLQSNLDLKLNISSDAAGAGRGSPTRVTRNTAVTRNIKAIDAIAVAYGPGLIGSLLVGVETARALALAWGKPLIGVNHLVGHIYANWLAPVVSKVERPAEGEARQRRRKSKVPEFPLVALVVSGGHTDLVLMKNHGDFMWLGGTRDDSAGEAFDKAARVLGLGYPGGPEIERLAVRYKGLGLRNFKLPRPMINSKDFDFSFSGIKTAVVNSAKSLELRVKRAEIAYEFQEAVTDVLVAKTLRAAKKFGAKSIVVGGGVAANSELRRRMSDVGLRNNIKIFFPSKALAIDNGAMIAAAAFYERNVVDPLTLRADPGLHF